jgi:crossover junction endodeoxyribonuclease RuvC
MSLIVGLDPGSQRMGYAVIEADGGKLKHLTHGTLKAPARKPLHERLAFLHARLCEVLEESCRGEGPSSVEVALERVFVAKNQASALTLGQARGIILLAVGQRGFGLAEYAPAEIKKAVTGNGRASKAQVANMVGRLLGVEVDGMDSDSTDALAMAICHAATLQTKRSLAGRLGA